MYEDEREVMEENKKREEEEAAYARLYGVLLAITSGDLTMCLYQYDRWICTKYR